MGQNVWVKVGGYPNTHFLPILAILKMLDFWGNFFFDKSPPKVIKFLLKSKFLHFF